MSNDNNVGFDFDDLLSILEDDTSNKENSSDVSSDSLDNDKSSNTSNDSLVDALEDEREVEKRMEEIRSIAKTLNTGISKGNVGSGDLDKDVKDWFNGKTPLPSTSLNSYVTNSNIKMSYGLSRNTLSNFDMMGNLRKFLNSSFDLLFSDSALLGLSPDELIDRVKVGFTIYKDLSVLNSRTILTLNEQRYKNGNDSNTDIDKLSMLLSSIPSDRLQKVLEDLSKG